MSGLNRKCDLHFEVETALVLYNMPTISGIARIVGFAADKSSSLLAIL